jgi:hypothetical protein
VKSCLAACFGSIKSITTEIGAKFAVFAVAKLKVGQLLRFSAD